MKPAFSIAFITGAVAVFQHFHLVIPDSIQALHRRFNIRLADIQVEYFCASFLPLPHKEPVSGWAKPAYRDRVC